MPSTESERRVVYRVNEDDTIVFVGGDWISFARENAAPHLTPDAVVGASLFEFLAGSETRHLYKVILDKVRSSRQPMVVPFRCDSPSERRYMELRISSAADNMIQLEARTLREQRRGAARLLDDSAARTDAYVVVCGWCKRVEDAGQWLEIEVAVERLGLFDSHALPQLTHGLCGACHARIQNEIEDSGEHTRR